ncbi:hypothetical protein LZ30DRAFT_183237 [Colletotrichum cereale]|nr:hypothetical protein LZ30DRAFT_183237 [Colletotrichum cereale]
MTYPDIRPTMLKTSRYGVQIVAPPPLLGNVDEEHILKMRIDSRPHARHALLSSEKEKKLVTGIPTSWSQCCVSPNVPSLHLLFPLGVYSISLAQLDLLNFCWLFHQDIERYVESVLTPNFLRRGLNGHAVLPLDAHHVVCTITSPHYLPKVPEVGR